MRKRLGSLRMIAKPFLCAIIFLPLFIPAMCHAQTCTQPAITSVTPSTWVAGQTYNVVVVGTGFLTPPKIATGFTTSPSLRIRGTRSSIFPP